MAPVQAPAQRFKLEEQELTRGGPRRLRAEGAAGGACRGALARSQLPVGGADKERGEQTP
eukprot:2928227-Rhodomonas_salina.2